jgi:hypothetical protein
LAKIVLGSGNAKLKVSFFGPFFFGDYWVIVGEPTGKYLWILCREAKPADPIKEMLMARAAGLGYDTSPAANDPARAHLRALKRLPGPNTFDLLRRLSLDALRRRRPAGGGADGTAESRQRFGAAP